jgi:outer membrane protein assembly factor BamE
MRIATLCLLSLSLITSGCSWIPFPSIHKLDIQQGNIVNQEMIDQLQPGMTKSQVQYILGTPLITDSFNRNRWDFYYSRVASSGERTEEQMTVFFDQEEKLVQMTGDYLPTSAQSEQ